MTVGKTSVLVLDCAEPMELAQFYAALLEAETRIGSDPDFVEIVGNTGVHLAVRRDHGYAPPSWPRPEDSQQAHLRILVDPGDMDEAEREAIGPAPGPWTRATSTAASATSASTPIRQGTRSPCPCIRRGGRRARQVRAVLRAVASLAGLHAGTLSRADPFEAAGAPRAGSPRRALKSCGGEARERTQ